MTIVILKPAMHNKIWKIFSVLIGRFGLRRMAFKHKREYLWSQTSEDEPE